MTRPVLGIDFGTSNSAAAWLDEQGRVRVAAIRENVYLLPTVAWYGPAGHMLVGQPARQQIIDDPKNTVFGLKRFLGLRYASPFVHRHKDRFAFELAEAADGTCGVRIGDGVKSLEDVAVDILKRVGELASVSAGAPFEECVITVPAHFGFAQRQTIRRAATKAGLRVRGMVNEPTAAAMYYARKKGNDGTVLVFDLGGGTFDATLMAIVSGVVKVLATGGDAFLGGADFDAKIVEHLVRRFHDEHGIDLRGNTVAVQRLLVAAEAAKIELSRTEDVRIRVPCITMKQERFLDLEVRLTRAELEQMTATLVERCVGVCEDILKRARLQALEVDEIVFVGGMTRMPAIHKRLADIFVANPSKNVHPDLGVVVGAALLTQGDHSLIDVTSMAVGLTHPGGATAELVPVNTPVPSVRRMSLERPAAGQPLVFGLYEAVDVTSLERDVLGMVRVPPEWLAKNKGDLTLEAWLGADLDINLFLHASEGEKLTLTLQKPTAPSKPRDPEVARTVSHPGFRSVGPMDAPTAQQTEPPASKPRMAAPAPAPSALHDDSTGGAAAGDEDGGPKSGETVGGYVVHDVIGRGGMGRVYLAEHKRLGRRVALKMLRRRYGQDPAALERFLSEARAVNQIRHENIIEVTDLFETDDGRACYIMEVLEGRSLAELIKSVGAPRLERTMKIAYQVASAMVAVHDAHIIHRDLKPENIYLTQRGGKEDFVKLLDFGVAKLVDEKGLSVHDTNIGARVGTLDYMPPEQIIGDSVDHRADIYAFGVVLYEMTTGQLPFKHQGNDRALLFAQLQEPIPPPSVVMATRRAVPPELDQLILQCLERDASRRPQTMREVRGRLEALSEKVARPRRAEDSPATTPFIQAAPNSLFQPTPTGEFAISTTETGALIAKPLAPMKPAAPPQRPTPAPALRPDVKGDSRPELKAEPKPEPPRPPELKPEPAPRVTTPSTVKDVNTDVLMRKKGGVDMGAVAALVVLAAAVGILVGWVLFG